MQELIIYPTRKITSYKVPETVTVIYSTAFKQFNFFDCLGGVIVIPNKNAEFKFVEDDIPSDNSIAFYYICSLNDGDSYKTGFTIKAAKGSQIEKDIKTMNADKYTYSEYEHSMFQDIIFEALDESEVVVY